MIAGALDLTVLALAGALAFALLAGSNLVRPLLVNLASRVPVIGGALAGEVENILNAWQRALSGPADAVLPVLTSLLSWLDAHGRHFLVNLGGTFDATYTALLHFQQAFIPHAIALAVGRLEGLIGDARTYALGLVQRAEQRARDLFAQAEADAGALVSAARQEATQEVQAAERVVLLEVRKAEEAAGSLFRQAEYDAGVAVAGAESRVTGLVHNLAVDVGTLAGTLRADIAKAEATAATSLGQAVGSLQGDLASVEKNAADATSQLAGQLGKDVGGILGSPGWALLSLIAGSGEHLLEELAKEGLQAAEAEIRSQIALAVVLRQRLAPLLGAALRELETRR